MAKKGRNMSLVKQTGIEFATGKFAAHGQDRSARQLLSGTLQLADPDVFAKELNMGLEQANYFHSALERIVLTQSQHSRKAPNAIMQQVLNKLLAASGGVDVYPKLLTLAERCGLFFDNVDEVLRFFRWVEKEVETNENKYKEQTTGVPSSRVTKDLEYWNGFMKTADGLMYHWEKHLVCEPCAAEFAPGKFVDAAFLITCAEFMLGFGFPVAPCAIFRLVSKARECKIDLEVLQKLAIAHIPQRMDDFYTLLVETPFDTRTCRELAAQPELVAALSYQRLKILLEQWRAAKQRPALLPFARSIRTRLYPHGIPQQGANKKRIMGALPLVPFLWKIQQVLAKANARYLKYEGHGLHVGSYEPANANILLAPHESNPVIPATPEICAPEVALPAEPTEKIEEYTGPMEEVTEVTEATEVTKVTEVIQASKVAEAAKAAEDTEAAKVAQATQEEEDSLNEDVLNIWMQRAQNQSDRLEADVLFTTSSIQQQDPPPAPSATSDMLDALDLIAEDSQQRIRQLASCDQDLRAVVADVVNIQELLTAAIQHDATGLLESWTRWIDEIVWRIAFVNGRLQQPTAAPVPIQEPAATDPAPVATVQTELPAPPVITPVVQESPAQTDAPALPGGALGALIQSIQSALENFPAGAMKRQFTRNLEAVRQQIIEGVDRRTTQRKLEKLKKDISELLEVNS